MSEEAEEQECECEEGLPAWMATFADMMALLMCFFVLLLSFATMDAVRFKKMAESMKDAFGVQQEIPLNEIVKGISVVSLEFSPSISEPTVIETVKQETTEEEKERLEVNDGPKDAGDEQVNTVPSEQVDEETLKAQAEEVVEKRLKAEAEDQAEELRKALKEEIDAGIVTVEVVDSNVIIRINEKGSFSSGSADLHPEFIDVLDRIAVAISIRPGKVIVAGHTDNRPISTRRFRSNWELSTARAVSVAHALLADPTLDPKRFLLEGHADSDPLVPNDSAENRALNRRVELIIKRVKDEFLDDMGSTRPDDRAKDKAIAEPVNEEPTIEPVFDPIQAPPIEPITESVVEPVAEPSIEPLFEPAQEPVIEPVIEPVLELSIKSAVEPVAEPTVEPLFEPVEEPIIEPVLELSTEPTDEPGIAPAKEEPLFIIETEEVIVPVIETDTVEPNDLLPAIAPKDKEQQDDVNSDKDNPQYDPIVVEDLI